MIQLFTIKSHFSTSLYTSYKVLGIIKGTSSSDIKKRYYQLAKMYHPDVNKQENSHQKFAEITKAYNFIIDNEDKSSIYQESDQKHEGSSFYKNGKRYNPYQTNSQKRTKTAFQQDWEDFQTFDEYYRSHKKFKKPKRGGDVYINLSISLGESFKGIKKKVKFSRKINCPQCVDQQPQTCISCGGKGQIFHRKNKQKMTCTNCEGFGFKLQCQTCNGSRHVMKDVQQEIYVQKGTHDKSILRVKNNGHQGYRHTKGDLYVTVIVQQSQKMRIDGNNVYSCIEIQYITAVFGGEVEIQTVQGKKAIQIQSGTQSGDQVRLFNYGIKSAYSSRIGDHIIKLKIKVPKKLSEYQRKLMSELMLEQTA